MATKRGKYYSDPEKYLKDRMSIDDETGCWVWQGAPGNDGYGRFRMGDKVERPHRASYQLFKGPVGDKFVCHKCDRPGCINPDHLFLGTHQENMADMGRKGRQGLIPQYGNKYRAKRVMADGIIYDSYKDAAKALGMSDNGIRKRIKLKWDGYRKIE